jgi:hypothetical protein
MIILEEGWSNTAYRRTCHPADDSKQKEQPFRGQRRRWGKLVLLGVADRVQHNAGIYKPAGRETRREADPDHAIDISPDDRAVVIFDEAGASHRRSSSRMSNYYARLCLDLQFQELDAIVSLAPAQ